MKNQYGFYLDVDSCTGCGTCVLACQDKNNLSPDLLWRRVFATEAGGYRKQGKGLSADIYAFYLTISCHHCQHPPCVEVCPAGALYKREEDGLVALDEKLCTGCEVCIVTCPYESLRFNKDEGKAAKCDGCLDLLAKAEPPACVSACPMRVLDFGPFDELRTKYPYAHSCDSIGYGAGQTLPGMLIKPHRRFSYLDQAVLYDKVSK